MCHPQSTLEFNLRKQEFVEFVKSDKRFEAVKYVVLCRIGDTQICSGFTVQ